MVTGGEKLRANFMYKDHFEFTPQFKLLVGKNHRPALSEVGEAMRRRLHLIPFNVTIPADQTCAFTELQLSCHGFGKSHLKAAE